MTPHSLSKPALAAGAALLITLLAAGCAFQTVREQQAKIAALCTISGTVRTERPTTNPLIVALVRQRGAGDLEQPANWDLFDHFVVEGSGSWHFLVSPGTYGLAAFEDRDSNLVYRPGEPFLGVDPNRLIACGRGGERRDIALVIPTEGKPRIGGEIDISKLQARTVHDQFAISIGLLTTVGEVTTLDDPRFSEENAKSGMWAPLDFTLKFRPGVYFLQPYERDRIPVLFVHGIEGTPATFRYLIGRLDRTRFQPWVYYYPSGASLGFTADHLTETMRNLQLEHGFQRFFVVAHSMGGLVSRGFILRYQDPSRPNEIPLYVTIATPWGGAKSAELGVKYAPAVVRSWYDMAPDSAYLRELFYQDPARKIRRTLPPSLAHHLMFTYSRNAESFGPSDDRVIAVASQMRAEAQQEARRLHGFDLTHTGVFQSAELSRLLNEILAAAAR
jgi:pimeloyl-ACP methyl ester carboxylesterase